MLKRKVFEDFRGKMTISDYDEVGELVKEVDENANVLYGVVKR